jgi:hypothetical protein
MNYEYHIVHASDFVGIGFDETPSIFDNEQDAFFHLAYMENTNELTVIRIDEDGCIYHKEGLDWIKIA